MAKNTIPAVEKTLQLLSLLGASDEPLSRREIERRLGLSSSTCYRILCTLKGQGYVRKISGKGWQTGRALLAAADNLYSEYARFAPLQTEVDDLSRETGFSSKLSIRRGDHQCTLLRGESRHRIQISWKAGAEFPVIEGSVGAVLVSADTPAEIRQAAARCEEDIPEKRVPEIILERLRYLRKNGYCLNDTPSRWHGQALSVPVPESDGLPAAALTLIGWEEEFTAERLPELVAAMKKYARLCAEKIRR